MWRSRISFTCLSTCCSSLTLCSAPLPALHAQNLAQRSSAASVRHQSTSIKALQRFNARDPAVRAASNTCRVLGLIPAAQTFPSLVLAGLTEEPLPKPLKPLGSGCVPPSPFNSQHSGPVTSHTTKHFLQNLWGQKSSALWFAKFLLECRVLSLLAGKVKFQEAAGEQDPVNRVITACAPCRLTCCLPGVAVACTGLLAFKAKLRNLSAAETGHMDTSCVLPLVPLPPSSPLFCHWNKQLQNRLSIQVWTLDMNFRLFFIPHHFMLLLLSKCFFLLFSKKVPSSPSPPQLHFPQPITLLTHSLETTNSEIKLHSWSLELL